MAQTKLRAGDVVVPNSPKKDRSNGVSLHGIIKALVLQVKTGSWSYPNTIQIQLQEIRFPIHVKYVNNHAPSNETYKKYKVGDSVWVYENDFRKLSNDELLTTTTTNNNNSIALTTDSKKRVRRIISLLQ